MNMKRVVDRQSVKKLSIYYGRFISPYWSNGVRDISTVSVSVSPTSTSVGSQLQNRQYAKPSLFFSRYLHSAPQSELKSQLSSAPKIDSGDTGDDGATNEFLSRFAWMMRKKLSEAYPECDKQTVDSMLLVIVEKVVFEMEKGNLDQMLGAAGSSVPSQDFNEDLWRTVWEVSNSVLEDMEKERKKEKMKRFLQDEEVKEMCRFAGEIGLQGDMLRELRFKWAREKMEEADFYESLERLREGERAQEEEEAEDAPAGFIGEQAVMSEEEPKVVELPKRDGFMKYKIYGLDLSDPKWGEVADKVNKAGEAIWPQEPKPISGKCRLVTEKILSLKPEDDPSSLLEEWKEILEPRKVDWVALLDQLKERDTNLYLKVAELLLKESSFQANIRDYSILLNTHAEESRVEDAERILQKMNDDGIVPDISSVTSLVHMYSKAGNLDSAKQAFGSLRGHGFQPDVKVYQSMIMAYVKAGQPKVAEASLLREMEGSGIQVPEEIYMALLASSAKFGDFSLAARISRTMNFNGFDPTLESCTLLVEAAAQAGDPDQARNEFYYMIRIGLKPDDRCIANVVAAHEKKKLLDKALNFLLELEGKGFELGISTYTVLIDWFGKMGLIDEVEQLLRKIAELGEVQSLKIQVILCDVYARAKMEKKALQALGVLEAKKEQLEADDFARVILGLHAGQFTEEAKKMSALMLAQGHTQSEELKGEILKNTAFVKHYGRVISQ
ncbi:Protein NUCLEAR FUSION DEFECTIVE 5, mitochondrial [Linum perenne]